MMPTCTNLYSLGQVRLLFLLPDSTYPERVEIKIQTVNLEAIIDKFEALSYTWGIPDPAEMFRIFNEFSLEKKKQLK